VGDPVPPLEGVVEGLFVPFGAGVDGTVVDPGGTEGVPGTDADGRAGVAVAPGDVGLGDVDASVGEGVVGPCEVPDGTDGEGVFSVGDTEGVVSVGDTVGVVSVGDTVGVVSVGDTVGAVGACDDPVGATPVGDTLGTCPVVGDGAVDGAPVSVGAGVVDP